MLRDSVGDSGFQSLECELPFCLSPVGYCQFHFAVLAAPETGSRLANLASSLIVLCFTSESVWMPSDARLKSNCFWEIIFRN